MMKTRLATVAAVAGAGFVALRLLRDGSPLPPPPGFVREIDGERIHYLDEGSGPAMVLIHGFGCSTFSWRHVMPQLTGRHRVIALDLPGFGYSDRSGALVYSLERHADRVVRLLDTLGVGRATIVGHSMGGAVAQRVATGYPGRVNRLVLLNAVDASDSERWNAMHGRYRWAMRPAVVGMRSRRVVETVVRSSLRQSWRDPALITPEAVTGLVDPLMLRGTAACFLRLSNDSALDGPAPLDEIAVPTLVVAGEHDRIVPPPVAKALATKIRGARHVIVPGIGHSPPEECPDALVDMLLTFTAERPAPAAVSQPEPVAG